MSSAFTEAETSKRHSVRVGSTVATQLLVVVMLELKVGFSVTRNGEEDESGLWDLTTGNCFNKWISGNKTASTKP